MYLSPDCKQVSVIAKHADEALATHQNSSSSGLRSRHSVPKEIRIINPQDKDMFGILVENRNICTNVPDIKYVVYVYSAANHFTRRQVLRVTWLNQRFLNSRDMARVFLLGRPDGRNSGDVLNDIASENHVYGDIVQGDFRDSYQNLSLKALMGLKWQSTYCSNAKLVIKVDDDVVVDYVKFLHQLAQYEDNSRTFICNVFRGHEILRDPKTCGKWCLPKDQLPGMRIYPDYCNGPLYAMTSDLPPLLYEAARKASFVSMEDAYLTGVLREQVSDVKLYQKDYKLSHNNNGVQMMSAWVDYWKRLINKS
jgi:beta-1,3-galactosyltransferase 1